MRILVLGGTGAMGVPLVDQLSDMESAKVDVTSRSHRTPYKNITYIQGNAHDDVFLRNILKQRYDAIIDFMIYKSDELKKKLPILLENTAQYFFFSSSRVYADSDEPLCECDARLLDVCPDRQYLNTDEYALAKAREEDLLKTSSHKNWTIIRPYITYNSQRLQLGVYEKEHWLFRALNGRTVILPKDIAEKSTSLTYGADVAKTIIPLIGNKKALGETFHIMTTERIKWKEVLQIYTEVIEEKTGIKIKVVQPDSSDELQAIWPSSAQIKYDRLYNRIFDNSKVLDAVGPIEYVGIRDGIRMCLEEFLNDMKWKSLNVRYEAWADRVNKEYTPLREISGKKAKIRYLKYRFFY